MQILKNSVTGEISVGWWENKSWLPVDYGGLDGTCLPEVDEPVLLGVVGNWVGEGEYRGYDGFHHVWKLYKSSGTYWDDEVVAWMPLPEPPEER